MVKEFNMFKAFKNYDNDPYMPFQPRRKTNGWLTTPQKRLFAYIGGFLLIAVIIITAVHLGLGEPAQEEVIRVRKPIRGAAVALDDD